MRKHMELGQTHCCAKTKKLSRRAKHQQSKCRKHINDFTTQPMLSRDSKQPKSKSSCEAKPTLQQYKCMWNMLSKALTWTKNAKYQSTPSLYCLRPRWTNYRNRFVRKQSHLISLLSCILIPSWVTEKDSTISYTTRTLINWSKRLY